MMRAESRPVDVIALCSAGGEIRPLRLRMEDEQSRPFRVDIDEVVSTKRITYVGVEAQQSALLRHPVESIFHVRHGDPS